MSDAAVDYSEKSHQHDGAAFKTSLFHISASLPFSTLMTNHFNFCVLVSLPVKKI